VFQVDFQREQIGPDHSPLFGGPTKETMNRILGICLLLGLTLVLSGPGVAKEPAFKGEVRIYYEFIRRSAVFYVLMPGGRIHEGMPKGGLGSFDFAKAKAATPKACGTYVQAGGKMKIVWGGGRPAETWVHEKMANGDENMDGNMWLKGVPLNAKSGLDGKYAWSVSLGTELRSAGDIIFRPNGTFTDSTTAYVGAEVDKKGKKGKQGEKTKVTSLAKRETSGTYAISGYTIAFTPTGAAATNRQVMTFGKHADPAKPSLIFLDGSLLRRKK
jgi:hypothetical protein